MYLVLALLYSISIAIQIYYATLKYLRVPWYKFSHWKKIDRRLSKNDNNLLKWVPSHLYWTFPEGRPTSISANNVYRWIRVKKRMSINQFLSSAVAMVTSAHSSEKTLRSNQALFLWRFIKIFGVLLIRNGIKCSFIFWVSAEALLLSFRESMVVQWAYPTILYKDKIKGRI